MRHRTDEQMRVIYEEWDGGGHHVFGDDHQRKDHADINRWIVDLLMKKTRSDEEENIVSLVYHSLNFDIPFKATAGARRDLLQTGRAKIEDPDWTCFPA